MAPRLYHISDNPNLTVMTPRIPNNRLVKAGYENGTIGRVCFAPSIDYAIAAAPRGKAGELLYVYIPTSVDKNAIYKPTPQEVPDVTYTHEIWYTKPVALKKVGVILVGDAYLEQRFLGPGSYNKHFILRFQNYKRFKNVPTDQEREEYWKSQPMYYKKLKEKEQKEQRKQKIERIIKKVSGAGLSLFMLVGNKLKKIGKDIFNKDSLYKTDTFGRLRMDAVSLNVVTLKKNNVIRKENGVVVSYDIMFGEEKIGTITEEKFSDGRKYVGKLKIKSEHNKNELSAHILKHYFSGAFTRNNLQ